VSLVCIVPNDNAAGMRNYLLPEFFMKQKGTRDVSADLSSRQL